MNDVGERPPAEYVLNTYSSTKGQSKMMRTHVTLEQKELLAQYIITNPEIITRDAPKEKEQQLWDLLVSKLNALKPEKSLFAWKNILGRWLTSLTLKENLNLTLTECKLKNFLNVVNSGTDKPVDKPLPPPPTTSCIKFESVEDINCCLAMLEKEKYQLNLEVDDNDLKIIKYIKTIKTLERRNLEKRQRLKQVKEEKMELQRKKRSFSEMNGDVFSGDPFDTSYKKMKEEVVDNGYL